MCTLPPTALIHIQHTITDSTVGMCPNTHWYTYNTPSPTALWACVQTPTDTHTTHHHRQHCVHASKHPLADTWTPQTQHCDCPNTHRQMHNTTPQHPKHCVCVQTSSDRCMTSTMCVWKHPLTDACMQHLTFASQSVHVCVCVQAPTDRHLNTTSEHQ